MFILLGQIIYSGIKKVIFGCIHTYLFALAPQISPREKLSLFLIKLHIMHILEKSEIRKTIECHEKM